MEQPTLAADDPLAADVFALLERHLAFMRGLAPPEDVHALDHEGLRDPAVSFYSTRRNGELLAIGALKELDETHGELKSMHTAEAVRRQGIARAMVEHLVGVARDRGYRRVSLETGTMDAFAPARSLYRSAGFEPCDPFAEYRPSPNCTCMTLRLDD